MRICAGFASSKKTLEYETITRRSHMHISTLTRFTGETAFISIKISKILMRISAVFPVLTIKISINMGKLKTHKA